MSKLTKNQKSVSDKIEAGKAYTLSEAANLVKEITYTTNDGTPVTSSSSNIPFGPYTQGTQIEITKKYNEYSNDEETIAVELGSSGTKYYSGIVLTKDITIGTLSEDLILNYNLAGNGKVINFVRMKRSPSLSNQSRQIITVSSFEQSSLIINSRFL